jgi:hypothetical protein
MSPSVRRDVVRRRRFAIDTERLLTVHACLQGLEGYAETVAEGIR